MTKIQHKPLSPEFDQSTYVALLLSVSHVCLSDQRTMVAIDRSRYGYTENDPLSNRVFERDSGYLIKLMCCEDETDVDQELAAFREAGFTEDFVSIIKYALYAKVLMLEFDTDVEASDRFKEFDVY